MRGVPAVLPSGRVPAATTTGHWRAVMMSASGGAIGRSSTRVPCVAVRPSAGPAAPLPSWSGLAQQFPVEQEAGGRGGQLRAGRLGQAGPALLLVLLGQHLIRSAQCVKLGRRQHGQLRGSLGGGGGEQLGDALHVRGPRIGRRNTPLIRRELR